MLKKFTKGLGLRATITRNSDEWLFNKKGASAHSSKVEYTVDHLRSSGSDFRASASQRPDPKTVQPDRTDAREQAIGCRLSYVAWARH